MTEATPQEMGTEIVSNKVHIEAPAKWLRQGWADFTKAPKVGATYGIVFVLTGYGLIWGLNEMGLTYLILPLAGAFILFSPWLALGLYEVSRQREQGQTPTFLSTCGAWKQSPRRLGIMAFVLLIVMLVWIRVAMVMYALMMGDASYGLDDLFVKTFSSTQGLVFLASGSLVGMAFAAIVFLLTVVSVPMILDRDIGAFHAMQLSIGAVMKNSHVMWSWAFTIGIIMWFGLVTFFLGLIIAMPVLGYASWHAYQDIIPQEETS